MRSTVPGASRSVLLWQTVAGQTPRNRLMASTCRARFLGVGDAEPFLRRERQHADLALVAVGVHVQRGLAGLLERVDLRQRRVDEPLAISRLASYDSR
jgi:hypothetical protein